MDIHIGDVVNNFNCDYVTATKITNILLRATNVSMLVKDMAEFSFCGVQYCLIKSKDGWIMARGLTVRSENIDDVLN